MTGESTARVFRLRVDGADIRVSVVGAGRPLLLFMGIGAPLELWDSFAAAMVPHQRQLIALDLPGAGGSPPLFPPRRMRGLVKLALGVIDDLGHDQVDVLGVSYGGAVAQEFAHREPARTRRLVLCATSPGVLMVPAKPSILLHLATPLRYWNANYAQRIIGDIYGGRSRFDPAIHHEMKSRFERPPSAFGYLGQLFAGWGWSSLPWLWRIKAPTLVLVGDDDPIIPVANGRILARLIPDARLEVVKGGGHLFLLEQAEDVSAAIDDFLG